MGASLPYQPVAKVVQEEDVRNSVETSGPPGPLVYAARA